MRILALIGFLGLVVALVGAIHFFGGFYSVAATEEDPAVLKWALFSVRNASIERHASDRAPGDIGSPENLQAGARAFQNRGCPICHGAPGTDWSKFSEAMRPDPPDLSETAKARPIEQIFWVIKNGINMTAMPGFSRIGVEDPELWQIAAFVKHLPNVTDADYKTWTSERP